MKPLHLMVLPLMLLPLVTRAAPPDAGDASERVEKRTLSGSARRHRLAPGTLGLVYASLRCVTGHLASARGATGTP